MKIAYISDFFNVLHHWQQESVTLGQNLTLSNLVKLAQNLDFRAYHLGQDNRVHAK